MTPLTHAYALGKCYLVERVDITDEMVERAARAVFDAIEREDTLVISGGLSAREWDDLPDGCQEHEHHRSYVRVALAAALATSEEREQ